MIKSTKQVFFFPKIASMSIFRRAAIDLLIIVYLTDIQIIEM